MGDFWQPTVSDSKPSGIMFWAIVW